MDDIDSYTWIDGEIVAGMVLGWNFGDGHLHQEQLAQALQAQCGFEPGEVRCVCIESQPIHRQRLAYRLFDVASGELERGSLAIADLREIQPWDPLPDPPHA